MSTYRLDKLFSPRSVAVIGASPREKSPGRAVLENLRRGGFAGEIDTAEFAILVRSDQKGHGLGWQLMQLIIAYARAQAIRSVHGQVLQENAAMLDMCRNLGFQVKADPEDPSLVVVTLSL